MCAATINAHPNEDCAVQMILRTVRQLGMSSHSQFQLGSDFCLAVEQADIVSHIRCCMT